MVGKGLNESATIGNEVPVPCGHTSLMHLYDFRMSSEGEVVRTYLDISPTDSPTVCVVGIYDRKRLS